ncbi:MAG: hypothetical protein ACK556_09490, partial [Pseudanabaena sp.]
YFTVQRIKALQDFSLTSAADLSLYFTCLQSNISFFFSKKIYCRINDFLKACLKSFTLAAQFWQGGFITSVIAVFK